METENIKNKNLLETVTELTSFLQASGEVDFDFFYRAYEIMNYPEAEPRGIALLKRQP